MKDFLVSVVIPVLNEQMNITPLVKKLQSALKKYKYEVIFIDDGSTDATLAQIKKVGNRENRLKAISFYRNFGHQMALAAGYKLAQGDCVVTMDADLQDPPEIIKEMIVKWSRGAKIVYAKREARDVDSWFKKITARFFYKLVNFLSDTPIPRDVGDFRLLDRSVVDFLNDLPEQSRFLRGLVAWGGFPAEYVYFKRQKRHAGETHYTPAKMINFALEGITSFSTKPLRLATYLGFIFGTLGFLGIIYAVLGKIFLPGHWVTGWTALFVGIMTFGGIQLITIGIIGEYISRIYKEIQRRPQYLIKEKINL